MTFMTNKRVRFAHVDAAGIVFYPRYFEMFNSAVEDYFAQVVGVDFAAMHAGRRIGVPTVKLEAEFLAPSRLGDVLDFRMGFDRVGGSSADLLAEVDCAGERRMRVRAVLVCMNLDTARSCPWPADMRPVTRAGAALSS